MASSPPSNRTRRMALSLSPELSATLFELAEAAGKPAATVVSELLAEMEPQLKDMTKLLRAVKSGRKDSARRALRHLVGNAMAAVIEETQQELPLGRNRKPGR